MATVGGRFWIPDPIIDYCLSKMGLCATRVLIVLARFKNLSDIVEDTKMSDIIERTGYGERSIQRALKTLQAAGLIEKITTGTGGRGVATKYRMFAQNWLPYQSVKDYWTPDFFADYLLTTLPLCDTRVMLVLSRYANKSGVAFPSIRRIANHVGYSERSVQRALKSLLGTGLIARISKGKGGRRISTKYRLFAYSWKHYKAALEPVAAEIMAQGPDAGDEPPTGSQQDANKPRQIDDGVYSETTTDRRRGLPDPQNQKPRQNETETPSDSTKNPVAAMSGEGSCLELEKENGQFLGMETIKGITTKQRKRITAPGMNEQQTRDAARTQLIALARHNARSEKRPAVVA